MTMEHLFVKLPVVKHNKIKGAGWTEPEYVRIKLQDIKSYGPWEVRPEEKERFSTPTTFSVVMFNKYFTEKDAMSNTRTIAVTVALSPEQLDSLLADHGYLLNR